MKDTIETVVLVIMLLGVFFLGGLVIGTTAKDCALRGYVVETCEPCPPHLQMQCIRDSWSRDYVSGKCGKKAGGTGGAAHPDPDPPSQDPP